MYINQNFGRIVRERREHKGLTLETASELCGISDKTLENIELGDSNPKLSTVMKIAAVLDIDIGILKHCSFTEKEEFIIG